MTEQKRETPPMRLARLTADKDDLAYWRAEMKAAAADMEARGLDPIMSRKYRRARRYWRGIRLAIRRERGAIR